MDNHYTASVPGSKYKDSNNVLLCQQSELAGKSFENLVSFNSERYLADGVITET